MVACAFRAFEQILRTSGFGVNDKFHAIYAKWIGNRKGWSPAFRKDAPAQAPWPSACPPIADSASRFLRNEMNTLTRAGKCLVSVMMCNSPGSSCQSGNTRCSRPDATFSRAICGSSPAIPIAFAAHSIFISALFDTNREPPMTSTVSSPHIRRRHTSVSRLDRGPMQMTWFHATDAYDPASRWSICSPPPAARTPTGSSS